MLKICNLKGLAAQVVVLCLPQNYFSKEEETTWRKILQENSLSELVQGKTVTSAVLAKYRLHLLLWLLDKIVFLADTFSGGGAVLFKNKLSFIESLFPISTTTSSLTKLANSSAHAV
ncbi:hypothetical protein [Vibrio sp. 99K-1]|uniref:hypothetical protein n=1 Tax=Vibrio sp. 99K-1 TaxID=2607603 RepID=UPI001493C9A2|nr:hypothetical protein [Vibrio sp. 99K-1]NOI86991.1 hypothetical protein [Vibrio sp. 99K-1]